MNSSVLTDELWADIKLAVLRGHSTGHKNRKLKETRKPFLYTSLCVSKGVSFSMQFLVDQNGRLTSGKGMLFYVSVALGCEGKLSPVSCTGNNSLWSLVAMWLLWLLGRNHFASHISKALTELDMPKELLCCIPMSCRAQNVGGAGVLFPLLRR